MGSKGGHGHGQVIKPARQQFARGGGVMHVHCVSVGLLGSDANFITMPSIAPEGRAKGMMNLDSDPNNLRQAHALRSEFFQ